MPKGEGSVVRFKSLYKLIDEAVRNTAGLDNFIFYGTVHYGTPHSPKLYSINGILIIPIMIFPSLSDNEN